MKKLALALMALSASLFGLSAVANAGTYPPPPAGVAVVQNPSVAPGGPVFVEIGCTPVGSSVDVTYWTEFPVATVAIQCEARTAGAASLLGAPAGSGSAIFETTAPTAPGTYTANYVGAATGSFKITVAPTATPAAPGGGLPATGSNGTSTMTIIAIGLFAVGAGLFGVSQTRRRTAAA